MRTALPVELKREVRAKHAKALLLAPAQAWLTRNSPSMSILLSQSLPIIFAEHTCAELSARIIEAIDSNVDIGRIRTMLEDLMVKELLGLGHEAGVWCAWAMFVMQCYRLPIPILTAPPKEPIGVETSCKQCGKVFVYPKPRHVSHRPRYCSDRCGNIGKHRSTYSRQSARTVICQWCGKTFETSKGRVKYCTTDCQIRRQRTVQREHDRETRRLRKKDS